MRRLFHLTAIIVLATVHAASADVMLDNVGVELPEELGGLRFHKKTVYPNPALGISLGYCAPVVAATLYVYDLGETRIPAGIDSAMVRAQFEQVKDEVVGFAKKYGHRTPELVYDGEMRLSAAAVEHAALHAAFVLRIRTRDGRFLAPRRSHVVLTGWRNKFLKLRFTYRAADAVEGERILKAFLEDLSGRL